MTRDGERWCATPELIRQARRQEKGVAALRAALEQSGLNHSDFSRAVMGRDPRTIQRWLSGESPIPKAVLTFLDRLGTK